ncbi:MAG: hypothetical protein FWD59_08835 [Micrococcales bacterium]|nr:hypothetical protein [Micrococcales bacterium]
MVAPDAHAATIRGIDTPTGGNGVNAPCATVSTTISSSLFANHPDLSMVTSGLLVFTITVSNDADQSLLPRVGYLTAWEVKEGVVTADRLGADHLDISVANVAVGRYHVEVSYTFVVVFTDGSAHIHSAHRFLSTGGATTATPPANPPLSVTACSSDPLQVAPFTLDGVWPPNPTPTPTPPPPTTQPPTPPPTTRPPTTRPPTTRPPTTPGPTSPTPSTPGPTTPDPNFRALSLPAVAGVASFGSRLVATPGTWSQSAVALTYQWLRAGVAIPGATATAYTPTKDDVGKTLQVRVTANAGGQIVESTSLATAKVAKAKPAVAVKLAKKKVALGESGKATVTVKVPGETKPVGKVTVRVGSKKVTVAVTAKKKGKVSVRLPALAKAGSYQVSATFKPIKPTNAIATSGTTAKTVKLTVK